MKHLQYFTPLLLLTLATPIIAAKNAAADTPAYPAKALSPHSFAHSKMTTDEPILLIRKDGAISGSLLFDPKKIIRVTYWKGDSRVELQDKRDFHWSGKHRVITMAPSSPAPFKTWEEMHPASGSPNAIGQAVDGKSDLFWAEGRVFHDLQVLVTYTHSETISDFIPKPKQEALANMVKRLQTKQPFKMVVLGDSISAGYNASGYVSAPPGQLPYAGLVANTLTETYGAPVSLANLSVAGKRSDWGVEMIPKVVAEKPDLVILAFGMNDGSSGVAPDIYASHIKAVVDGVRSSLPECQFVLVSPMTGNPEWTGAAPDLYPRYRDALEGMTQLGVALADVTTTWTAILKRKQFVDLTGNGVNHPNDFGHQIYAAVILSLFADGQGK